MANTIQMKRGTAAALTSANPTLAAGEPCLATDTKILKIGDGSTAYNSLPAFGGFATKRTFLVDGGGDVITTGLKGGFECPITGHITQARVISLDGTSGSIAVAVWIEPYAGGVPVDADEVDIFSLSSAVQSEETGLTIDVAAGDWISFNVDSATSLKLVAVGLTFE